MLSSDGTIDPDNPDGLLEGPNSGGGDDILGCSNTYEEILLNTGLRWGQGNPNVRGSTPYNANTPFKDCNRNRYVNGRVPVGCVAVAVGQIMRSHQFPENLDWANMPLDNSSAPTAELLAEIGGFLNMTYKCNGSSTPTRRAADVFTDDYGYSSAVFKDFNPDELKREIRLGFPIMLRGGNDFDETCVLNWCWAGGHAWVCEGFRRTVFCDTGSSHLLLWMNWGWRGGSNGWFGLDAWNPLEDGHFNTNRKMIVNIRP